MSRVRHRFQLEIDLRNVGLDANAQLVGRGLARRRDDDDLEMPAGVGARRGRSDQPVGGWAVLRKSSARMKSADLFTPRSSPGSP
jgi:hypothetical protein